MKDGINPDSKDSSGQTPLVYAIKNGHKAVVELLLAKNSISINTEDNGGRAPQSWEVEKGYEAIVKLPFVQDDIDPSLLLTEEEWDQLFSLLFN
jgi:ankyrin repeat protein